MDFAACPRCQEMNPGNAVKCAACGASMDEEPVEVPLLPLAQEPEPEPEPKLEPEPKPKPKPDTRPTGAGSGS